MSIQEETEKKFMEIYEHTKPATTNLSHIRRKDE